MTHATRRAIRRAAELKGGARSKPLELWSLLKRFEKEKVPSSLDIHEGQHVAARVCVKSVVGGGRIARQVIRTFIHPTKKATLGRIATLRSAI